MNGASPSDERARLDALRRYAILDTPAEAAFDRITRLAAQLLGVPISLVTLVDEQRQWFKSHYGFEARETSRDVSFCAHAMLGEGVMVVRDAAEDPRFAANALVTGDPRIRFYAGAPLKSSDGFSLGTLCTIDTKPRELTAEEEAILADLAAMARGELELRLAIRQRDQQMTAVRNLKSGVVVTDAKAPDCPIVFVNAGFCATTGYEQEEILGRNCRFLQGPETDPKTVQSIREAVAEHRTFQGELLNYRKDGSAFWNEFTVSPVFDQAGELVNFVGSQSDITERREAAEALRQSYERLKELEALRDSLTQMIIHDLRSPLTGVTGFLEILAMTTAEKLNSRERGYIETARSSAAKIEEMITQLLDVNRLEQGQMPVNLSSCDLSKVVQDAVDAQQHAQGAKRLELELPDTSVSVHCDSELVRRVICNLVSNALKFTPTGGQVRVNLANRNSQATVSVSDDGPGIAPEYHQKIFEKFGQVENRRQIHSTGLGLTFCKLAMEVQGGSIGLESTWEKAAPFGSRCLPCREEGLVFPPRFQSYRCALGTREKRLRFPHRH